MPPFTTAAEQLAALRAPFDPAHIKTREQAGQTLSYFPMPMILNRLLDVVGTGLSMTVERVEQGEDRIEMCVRMTVKWIDGSLSVIDSWGSADVMRSKATQKVVSDARKVAFSDACKVCASKFGVGLDLYDKDYLSSLEDAPGAHATRTSTPSTATPPAAPNPTMARFKRGK